MEVRVEVAIFGAGAAGLWLIDELRRRGRRAVLFEARALGSGQTVASQGIIHGGLKYSLGGVLSGSARSIREMPGIWRACLAAKAEPDLSAVPLRAEHCYLWRTESLVSRAGMVGARAGLRVKPVAVEGPDRPAALAGCPGQVFRLDEQVIDTVRFAAVLGERNRPFIVRAEPSTVRFESVGTGTVGAIAVDGGSGGSLIVHPKVVVLTAGSGNADLREALRLGRDAMQTRPLHMTLVRGDLPVLNGHCVDGSKTRVTITTARRVSGGPVWQVGGAVSERGVEMDEPSLIRHVRDELVAALPGFDPADLEWATYRVNRAEGRTATGARPEDVTVHREGHVITAWPTKLALAPLLAERVAERIDALCGSRGSESAVRSLAGDLTRAALPGPVVALPPWETIERWNTVD